MMNLHLKNNKLLGSDTDKWYHSRFIWVGTAQVLYGMWSGTPEWIFTGIGTIVLRFNTKKALK
jgi:hypothetical protein